MYYLCNLHIQKDQTLHICFYVMQNLLNQFVPISLDEMKSVRLMNRTDTKFVTTIDKLKQFLTMAQTEYRIQEIDGERNMPYYTLYYDTVQFDMYKEHIHGHSGRQKVRMRSYVNAGQNYIEVKTKDNHGRTKKKRMRIKEFNPTEAHHDILFDDDDTRCEIMAFLRERLKYSPELLREAIENNFRRITLVNNNKTERVTIDTDLRFKNLKTGYTHQFPDIVIIELKRDGQRPSPIKKILNTLRIKPHKFSKYCIGSAVTNSTLPTNRLKSRLKSINKIIELSNTHL